MTASNLYSVGGKLCWLPFNETSNITYGKIRRVPRQIEGPNRRNLQLHFKTKLSLPIFTGGNVGGENGLAIQVLLCDANTGLVVASGPEACSKLDVLVLEGDFNNEDGDSWTEKDFNIHLVTQREGKRPLLIGDLQVTLKDGIGTLGELSFTDNSSWVRSRKFRIGARIASGYCNGIVIREATTEAFIVRDHRGEGRSKINCLFVHLPHESLITSLSLVILVYKKHYPPSLKDEVWRLEKIGKDGQFHKRLSENDIHTVEHFLKNYNRCPQQLHEVSFCVCPCLHSTRLIILHLLSHRFLVFSDPWEWYVR